MRTTHLRQMLAALFRFASVMSVTGAITSCSTTTTTTVLLSSEVDSTRQSEPSRSFWCISIGACDSFFLDESLVLDHVSSRLMKQGMVPDSAAPDVYVVVVLTGRKSEIKPDTRSTFALGSSAALLSDRSAQQAGTVGYFTGVSSLAERIRWNDRRAQITSSLKKQVFSDHKPELSAYSCTNELIVDVAMAEIWRSGDDTVVTFPWAGTASGSGTEKDPEAVLEVLLDDLLSEYPKSISLTGRTYSWPNGHPKQRKRVDTP